MVTKREALKLALEALENAEYGDYDKKELNKAITAIREALAQPEQEPVAWGMMNNDGKIYDCICPEEHDRVEGEYTTPLYTTPPQRPWVGLTWDDLPETAVGDVGFMQGAKWAEAKLKEKNHG